MGSKFNIAVILNAQDKMSSIINSGVTKSLADINKLKQGSQTKMLEGGAMIAAGMGIIATLNKPIKAFEQLEEANSRLRGSLMDSKGRVPADFQKIVRLSTELGNKLPGATKDFNELFQAMTENGVRTQSILEGAGKAAAYLAVDLKMPMQAAGQYSARMQQATGVLNKDLIGLFDTISQLKAVGINADEMQYAFSRASGTLKMLGLQGLQSSRDMGVFYATLIRNGQSGETAATSFNSIIQNILNPKIFAKAQAAASAFKIHFDFFKDGKFLGVENMVSQFEKLNKLDPTQTAKVVNALTGGGQDAQALNIIIQNGLNGYKKMQAEVNAKAGLQQKINEQLGTLSAIKEATQGTIENLMAAFGNGLAPVLKAVNTMLGNVADKTQGILEANPAIAKFLSMATLLTGVFVILGGAIKTIQAIRIAMTALNITMAANPILAVAMGIVLAVSLIYAYWEPLKKFFSDLWDKLKGYAENAWKVIEPIIRFSPLGIIINNWEPIKRFFKGLWGDVGNGTDSTWDKIKKAISFDPMPKLKEVWGKMESFFATTWEGIKAAFDLGIVSAKLSLKNFTPIGTLSEAWDGLSAYFGIKWEDVKKVFTGMFEWYQQYAKGFFNIGADIVKYFIEGLTSKINMATGLMKFLTNGIRKDLLGQKEVAAINTMSRLPARVGPFQQTPSSFSLVPANFNQSNNGIKAAASMTLPPKSSKNLTGKPTGQINDRTSSNTYFNNQFTISLAGQATQKDADLISENIEKQFGRLMKKYNNNKGRVEF